MIYAGNQWISFDDAQSFEDKKKFLSERCLGGLMVCPVLKQTLLPEANNLKIWAVDQDTQDYKALAGLLGDDAVGNGLIQGGGMELLIYSISMY